jgi:LPXTG-motif cell wall-anchored protein
MLSRRQVRSSLATVLTTALLASFAGTAMVAIPAQADSPEVSHSPQHVWVDPTAPNADGNYEWSVTIFMPPITSQAVTNPNAIPFTNGVVHCQAPAAEDGGVLSCEGTGDPVPGEYTIEIDLISVGSQSYSWEIPLTVCPLTGCSDLFSLTISPDPMVIWANPSITEQTYGRYDFNIDWNADEVKLDELRDAQGSIAPGMYDPVSEIPRNGSQFGYRGSFTQPGYYFGTVTMIDEFGGEHDAPYTVRVCTPETCADLLALPDTGVDTLALLAAGTFAGLTLAAGSFMLIVRRRRS